MASRAEHFFWIVGPRRRARLRLNGSFFVVGRLEPFPIFHDDPTISREHAAVVAGQDGVRVRDLGSKNGVLLNGKRLERYAEVGLSPGDVLRVGNTELRLLLEGEDPTAASEGDHPRDEHAVDDTGRSRAITLGTPPPPVPAAGGSQSDVDGGEDDELHGEATSVLDVPDVPTDRATGAAPAVTIPAAAEPPAAEPPAAEPPAAEPPAAEPPAAEPAVTAATEPGPCSSDAKRDEPLLE